MLKQFGHQIPATSSQNEDEREYLVQVVKRNAISKTFDELCLEMYSNCNPSNFVSLPPTSSAIMGHLQRLLYGAYMCISFLFSVTVKSTGVSMESSWRRFTYTNGVLKWVWWTSDIVLLYHPLHRTLVLSKSKNMNCVLSVNAQQYAITSDATIDFNVAQHYKLI